MQDLFKKLGFKSTVAPTGPMEYLVVGLGNPGQEYANTRHNAGFLAVDAIAKKLDFSVDRIKFKGLCGDTVIDGHRVLFLKPSTFMNLSGEAVVEALQFYKLPMEKLIVLYDDVALDVGRVRIRKKGSDGGHNGIKNIIFLTGRDDFPRIRFGVGKKPNPQYDLADWVLGRFSPEDHKLLDPLFDEAADMVRLLVGGKYDEAMSRYNHG